TFYRLPRSALPALPAPPPGRPRGTTDTYPGVSDERPTDVSVDCVAESSRSGGFLTSGPSSPITLANGTRAQVYVGGAGLVVRVSGTVCLITGWTGTGDLLHRFARELRPL